MPFRTLLAVELALFLMLCAATLAPAAAAQSTALARSHPDLSDAPAVAPMAAARPLTFDVVLALQNRARMRELASEQQEPGSPNYHRWLTPREFRSQFGPTPAQVAEVVNWLTSEGFTVLFTDPDNFRIRVSGSAAQIDAAFGAGMVSVGTRGLFANSNDLRIPAALAGLIGSVRGLDNLHAARALGQRSFAPQSNSASTRARNLELLAFAGTAAPVPGNSAMTHPDFTFGGKTAFGPADLHTFYDENPVLNSGITGTGDCIAIVGDSDYLTSAVTQFDTTFGLPAASIATVLSSSQNGTFTNPGRNDDEVEALLDLEWSHSAAPGAPIRFYLGDDSNSANGGVTDAISRAVSDNACSVMSISFGFCSSNPEQLANDFAAIFTRAAMQGMSVFASSGDAGAAGLVFDPTSMACVDGTTRNAEEPAQDPNVTAVGGTSFSPTFDTTGAVTGTVNDTTRTVWDGSTTAPPPPNTGAGGGGASTVFAKPAYQTGVTPNDGARDEPDVALLADPLAPGVFFVNDADVSGPGTPELECCIGGTSLSAQVFGGFTKLIEQKAGMRLGNINTPVYRLAAGNAAASGLRDITTGINSFNGVTGFSAAAGYDLASGWGAVDVAQFLSAMTGAVASSSPASASGSPGQTIANAGTFTLTNNGASAQTVASVTVSFSDPNAFSSASVAGGGQTATVTPPAASTVFTFPTAVAIGAGGSVTFTLSITIAMNPAMLDVHRSIAYAAIIGGVRGFGRKPRTGILALVGGLILLGFGVALVGERRRRVAVAGAALLALVLVAGVGGCGGGGGGGTPPSQIVSKQSLTSVAATESGNPVSYLGLPADLGTITVQ